MNWKIAILTLVPWAFLLMQGTACLKRHTYVRGFGLLNLFLCGTTLVLWILLTSGTLVISPEFDSAMVQGIGAWYGMLFILCSLAVDAAICLAVSRMWSKRTPHLLKLMGGGVLVGALAGWDVRTLNPTDLEPLRIYMYDFWSPALLVWISLCLLDTLCTVLRISSRPIRVFLAIGLVYLLALLVSVQPYISALSPDRRLPNWVWSSDGLIVTALIISLIIGWTGYCLWSSWPVRVHGMASFPFGMVRTNVSHYRQSIPRPTGNQLAFLIISVVLNTGTLFMVQHVAVDHRIALGIFMLSWVLLGEAVARGPLSTLLELLVSQRLWTTVEKRVKMLGGAIKDWLGYILSLGFMPSTIGKALVLLIVVIAVGELPNAGKTLILPFKVAILPEWIDMHLSERKGESGQQVEQEPDETKSADAKSADTRPAPQKSVDIGQVVAERVVNTLGLLQQELQRDILLSVQSDDQDTYFVRPFTLVDVVGATEAPSIALGRKEAILEYGGVQIPLSLLYAPVQMPMRWMLGVGIIQGSVHVEQRGNTLSTRLLAGSNYGGSWQIPWSPQLADAPRGESNVNGQWENVHGSCSPPRARNVGLAMPSVNSQWLARMVDDFADKLAFDIIRSDQALGGSFTKSWGAFKYFRQGLDEWRDHERKQGYIPLRCAIAFFMKAIDEDPTFALAYYRLGLARQRNEQPADATRALKASLKADPGFIPATIALATVLYDFEGSSHLGEAGLLLDLHRNPNGRKERRQEARELWKHVVFLPKYSVSVPNRASAYYGLCRQARREKDVPDGIYLAYYYCKRAVALYTGLAAVQQDNTEIQKGEAAVLRAIGLILARAGVQDDETRGHPTLQKGEAVVRLLIDRVLAHAGIQQETAERKQPEWDCHWKALLKDPRRGGSLSDGPFLNASLWYLTKALSLAPEDQRIRCDAARTAFAVHGNAGPLLGLKADWMVHLDRAEIYRRLASACAFIDGLGRDTRNRMESSQSYERLNRLCFPNPEESSGSVLKFFELASQEYEEAITRNPNNINAMIGYAHNYWRQQVYDQERVPGSEYAGKAKKYADRVVSLMEHESYATDVILRAMARARLGEIIFSQVWPKNVIEELKTAINALEAAVENLKSVTLSFGDHPALDQMSWSLVQVYRCLGSIERLCVGSTGFQGIGVGWDKKVDKVLAELKSREDVSEFQPFTGDLPLFAKNWGAMFCQNRISAMSLGGPINIFSSDDITSR